jgi:hypothetical protein
MGRPGGRVETRAINYSPLPSQRRFHACQARFKGFSGPIGSGKSQALCQEAIRLCYQNPGRMGLLGAPTYPMLRDATQATLFEILESNRIPYDYNKAENTLLLADTKSRIIFRPVDDFERLRGTNLAWFGLDELTYTQEEAWLRLEGRLRDPKAGRLCGFAVWTPKGYDWVHRRFVSDTTANYKVIRAPGMENSFLLKQIPDFYDRLKSSYDEKFFAQEVLGEYLHLTGGTVYAAFDRKIHVKSLPVDKNQPLRWTLDFNVDPMSSLIVQMDGEAVRVLDEIVIRDATTMEACEEFLKRYPRHAQGVWVYGDASGNQKQTTGYSDFKLVKDHLRTFSTLDVNYRIAKANPSVKERINLMNSKLRSAAGEISLLVDPKCKELIKDFEQVAFKANTFVIDKDRDRQRTHLSDALGYLLWQEFKEGPGIGERQGRLLP